MATKKTRAMPDIYRCSQSCSKASSHRGSLAVGWNGWPWAWPTWDLLRNLCPQRLSLLCPTGSQKDPPGLFWDRQLSFSNNFFFFCKFSFTVQPSAYHSANYDCQLGNNDVCPVETSWDHIWILKHRYFLLCKVRPFFFLGIFKPETINNIFASSCTPSSGEPSVP